jgi:hypothetical protein
MSDAADLVRSILWPAVAAGALYVFRDPMRQLLGVVGQRVEKISIWQIKLELSKLPEFKPSSLDVEFRQASIVPQSGTPGLFSQLRTAGRYDYIVVDLGSDERPRWLTSRLYILALLLSQSGKLRCFVFVETLQGSRNIFTGIASMEAVRWALARDAPWLENDYVLAYSGVGVPVFDEDTGMLTLWQQQQLVSNFIVGVQSPPQLVQAGTETEWVELSEGLKERAKWAVARRLEHILGNEMISSSITMPLDNDLNSTIPGVLRQRSRYIAIVDVHRRFIGLIDRHDLLDKLAAEHAREIANHA